MLIIILITIILMKRKIHTIRNKINVQMFMNIYLICGMYSTQRKDLNNSSFITIIVTKKYVQLKKNN